MKTSGASLLALVLYSICSFFSGCLIHYHYQANVIEIRLRPSDDPRKIWSAIDDVAEGLGYQAKAGVSSRDFDGFQSYVHPGYWNNSAIHVHFDKTSRVLRIEKRKLWHTADASSVDIDSHVDELRTRLAKALPGMRVIVVTIREEGQADLFPLG